MTLEARLERDARMHASYVRAHEEKWTWEDAAKAAGVSIPTMQSYVIRRGLPSLRGVRETRSTGRHQRRAW